MILLGTSVGGGIIINGTLHDGAHNYAGELSNITPTGLLSDGLNSGIGKN